MIAFIPMFSSKSDVLLQEDSDSCLIEGLSSRKVDRHLLGSCHHNFKSLFLLFFFLNWTSVQAIDFTFTGGGADDNWTTTANWTPSYPGTTVGPGNTITINATVNIDATVELSCDVMVNANVSSQLAGFYTQVVGTLTQNSGLWTGQIFSDPGAVVVINSEWRPRTQATSVLDGDLVIGALGVVSNQFNSTALTINGDVSGTGRLLGPYTLNGTITPAGPASTGEIIVTMITGGYNATTTNIDINGTTPATDHDVITTTNNTDFIPTGTLNLNINYTPNEGDAITFVSATNANIIGSYAVVAPSGWTVAYNSPSPGKITATYSSVGFITTWETTSANETITIPTIGSQYDFTIDWGDGNPIETFTGTDPDPSHSYTTAGSYQVEINGDFPRIYFNNGGDKDKIKSIDQWGNIEWTSMDRAFSGCSQLTYKATDAPDLSSVTTMGSMFQNCVLFNGDLNNWDVSNVTFMGSVFAGASAYNQPLNNWDMANVNSIQGMFSNATSFNQSLANWDLSSLTAMSSTFAGATSFNQPLNSWGPNLGNVTNLTSTFEGATAFNQSLDSWDVSKVTSTQECFKDATAFNGKLAGWRLNALTNARFMFNNATSFNRPLNDWGSSMGNVTEMFAMFSGASSFNQPLDNWDVSSVTTMHSMFANASSFNQSLNTWDVSSVSVMQAMFSNATSFNSDISAWVPNSVTVLRSMFSGATSFNQPLNNWGPSLSNVQNMGFVFDGATSFNQPLDTWDVSTATDMNGIFRNASAFDQSLGAWDMSSVTNAFDILQNAGLSIESYDQTLIGWATRTLQMNVPIRLTGMVYCTGEAARQSIITNYGWNFNASGDAKGSVGNCGTCALAITNLSFTAANCPATNDGSITVTASGVASIEYSIDGGAFQPSPTFTSLGVGIYEIVARDVSDNTCADTAQVPVLDFDTQAPTFTSCLATYNADLNLCDEYTLDANALGITATDNCGGPVTITFVPAMISGVGTTAVVATATDEIGNSATCNFNLTLAQSPDKFTITATNDNFSTDELEPITFTTTQLLSNDGVSPNTVTLDVEEVSLADPTKGSLTQIDATTYSFIPAGGVTGNVTLNYSVKVQNGASFFDGNGHFYEVVATTLLWEEAKNAAAAKSLVGLPGYLATITSQEENDFILNLISERAWIGASDRATEGDWRWVTGPEGQANGGLGTPFWSGDQTGSPVSNAYNGWVVSPTTGLTTEPNDLMANANDGEHWAHMFPNTSNESSNAAGKWNDFPVVNRVKEYVVEYGALDGCSPAITANADIIINVQPNPNTGFITTWETSGQNAQTAAVTIYTNTTDYTYDYTIDWGDGTVQTNQTGNVTHTYSNHDELHTIKISGTFPHFQADNNNVDPGNAHKLRSIQQWGNIAWQNFFRAFNNALFMTYNASDAPNLTNVKRLARTFPNCFGLDENTDLSNWDVSNVEDFTHMFLNAFNFNGNIDNWDLSSATTTFGMFELARKFNRDISGWDMSNVTSMVGMFSRAESFDQNIGGWDVGNVTLMIDLFKGATAFNQDISMWDMGSVIDTRSMFADATSFNQDISDWDMATVRGMMGMFFGATNFDQDLGDWNITGLLPGISLLRVFTNSGMSTESYDATLIGWGPQNVAENISPVGVHGLTYCDGRDARQNLIDNKGWFFEGDAIDDIACRDLAFITTWNTTASDPTIDIFVDPDFTYNYTVDWGDGNVDENVTTSIQHTYSNHSAPHTVQITGEFPHFIPAGFTYFDIVNPQQLNSVEQWGAIKWKSMYKSLFWAVNMVYNATDKPDLSEVTDMTNLFTITDNFNADLNDWDVSKVQKMDGVFARTAAFNGNITNWDLSGTTSMNSMFHRAEAFNQDIGRWDVSGVRIMRYVFEEAPKFNQDISRWEVSQVTAMTSFLRNAEAFNQNLADWKLNSLQDARAMLDTSGIDLANYDATLIGWAANPNIASNVTIGVDLLEYCAGESARNDLINNKGWTFDLDTKVTCLISPTGGGSSSLIDLKRENLFTARKKVTQFTITPDRVENQIQISIKDIKQNSVIRIQDQFGRIVWTQSLSDEEPNQQVLINSEKFPAGTYQVSLDSGHKVLTEQLILTE